MLSVIFPILFFFFMASHVEEVEMWLLFIFPAFLVGSLAAHFCCSEFKIVVQHFRKGRRGLYDLLIIQGIGAAFVGAAFILERPPKSLSSIADGVALYPFVIGFCAIVFAPIVIWERSRGAS
jgi:hypothetical protein